MSGRLLAWPALIGRLALGLLFFQPGLHRVFVIGPLEHARRFFVEPYAETFLPVLSLWTVGTAVPFVELACGALLLVGLWIRPAAIVLGLELLVITFGHLLADPFYAIHGHVFPRLALVLFVLVVPPGADRWSLDRWRGRRRQPDPKPSPAAHGRSSR